MQQKILSEGINFNKMPYIYWSDRLKASCLQRQIIVHSILYYHLSENVISDVYFDNLGRQLMSLREQMSENEYKRTEYYYCFDDFDGTTGFYLYDALTTKDRKYLTSVAKSVLRQYKRERIGG